MSKFLEIKNDFSRGEFAPNAFGNTNTEDYLAGCKTSLNAIPRKNRGIGNRPGIRFEWALNNTPDDPAMLPIVANKTTGYVVIVDPDKAEVATSSGDPFIKIYNTSGTEMTVTDLFGGSGVTQPNFLPSFATGVDPRGFVFTQVGDVLFVADSSGEFPPFYIFRVDATNFEVVYAGYAISTYASQRAGFISTTAAILRIPFMDTNIGPVTMTPAATTGNTTLTASANFFDAGHVGAIFKLTHSGTTGYATVTGFTSATQVSISVGEDFGATTATTDWEESAWSNYRGWPRGVTFHQRRLVWGPTRHEPDTIRGSLVGNVFHLMEKKFAQDQGASSDSTGFNYFGDDLITDPYSISIGAQGANIVTWLASKKQLNVGTLSEEFIGQGINQILSGDSADFQEQTSYGSRFGKVVKVGDEILYITSNERRLRNFKFNENNGSNISSDLSFFNDALYRYGGTGAGFKDICYQKSRDVVWLINDNKELVSFTYKTEAPVLAWAKHSFTGVIDVVGMCSIPSGNGSEEDLYILTKKTVNSATVYHVERLPQDFEATSLDNDSTIDSDIPAFLDSCKVITLGSASDTLTGLGHLEAEEVTVTKDGYLLGDFTVSSGSIDLGQEYTTGTRFVVGHKFTTNIVELPVRAGGNFGPGIANIKRVDQLLIRFYNTYYCKVKETSSDFDEEIEFGDDLFTGVKVIPVHCESDREVEIEYTIDQPYPCNILYSVKRGEAND